MMFRGCRQEKSDKTRVLLVMFFQNISTISVLITTKHHSWTFSLKSRTMSIIIQTSKPILPFQFQMMTILFKGLLLWIFKMVSWSFHHYRQNPVKNKRFLWKVVLPNNYLNSMMSISLIARHYLSLNNRSCGQIMLAYMKDCLTSVMFHLVRWWEVRVLKIRCFHLQSTTKVPWRQLI